MGALAVFEFKIASGQTDSNEVDLREYDIVAFQIGTFTGATFSFKARAKADGTSVAVVDNAANVVSISATDDRYIVLDEEPMRNLSGLAFAKIVSAGAEGADRTVYCIARRCL